MSVGKREHRTEVTEVTEGDLRLGAKGLRVNSGDFVRETAETKRASHGGHGGGVRLGAKGLRVNSGDFVRETAETKRASHRGHGGHRGGLRLGAKGLRVNSGILCEKQPKRREHRTEVTEGGLRLGAKGLRVNSGTSDTDTATGGSRSPNGRKPRGKSRSRDSTKPCRPGILWRFRTHRPNWRNPLGRRRRCRDHYSTKLCHPNALWRIRSHCAMRLSRRSHYGSNRSCLPIHPCCKRRHSSRPMVPHRRPSRHR